MYVYCSRLSYSIEWHGTNRSVVHVVHTDHCIHIVISFVTRTAGLERNAEMAIDLLIDGDFARILLSGQTAV